MGLHIKGSISDSFLGNLTEGILVKTNTTTYIYKPFQPISTIKRHLVLIPENAEYESGFSFWLAKVWNIALNTGAKMIFYSSAHTLKLLKDIYKKHPIEAEFKLFNNWSDFQLFSKEIKRDDNIIIILSRRNTPSYHSKMKQIPSYLNMFMQKNNFMLIYPMQTGTINKEKIDLANPSLLETIEKIDILGKTIANIFRRK